MKKQVYNGTEYLGTRGPRRQPQGWLVHCVILHCDKSSSTLLSRLKIVISVVIPKKEVLSLKLLNLNDKSLLKVTI